MDPEYEGTQLVKPANLRFRPGQARTLILAVVIGFISVMGKMQ